MSGKAMPKDCFLSGLSVWKVIEKRKVYRSVAGDRLYTWDDLHGEVEVFNKRGQHLGVADYTGKTIGEAVRGRVLNV